MSLVPAIPDGMPRVLSRFAVIAMAPGALIALRSDQGLVFVLAVVAAVAFESNCHPLGSILRLLAIVMQIAALAGFAFLGYAIANFAESGRDAPFFRGLAVLVVVAIVLVVGAGTWAAVRTLQADAEA